MTASEASRRLPLAFRASQNILRLEKQSDFIGHLYIVDPYFPSHEKVPRSTENMNMGEATTHWHGDRLQEQLREGTRRTGGRSSAPSPPSRGISGAA